jgi:hypothetical protein
MDDKKITYFATTDSRSKKVPFGIKAADRTRHVYVIGKTGMGKSTLLENMAVQDIQNGEGLCFVDPHGKTADLLLEYVPENRIDDVVYFAPFDLEHPISFNVMEDVGPEKRHLVVSGLMSAFKKFFGEESFSDRMQYILQNTILALLEYPGSTMLGINRMLTDKAYREKVVANVTDEAVKTYWVQEFAKYTEKFAAEATPAIQNKIGQFTSNPLIRNIIGQPKSSFDIRRLMDEKKIFIVNLSKGRVGESNAALLGSMLVTKIYLAAMSRADVSDKVLKTLPNFYLFVDEFQSFANDSFADILSEARKYKLNLTIAHQYVEQMPEEVRSAVFGNVGTMIVFRVGAYDAELFEKEFAPQFTAEDIVNLGQYQIYLKLMIDGVGSQPFSGRNLPPIKPPSLSFRKEIVESSRRQFAKTREQVEKDISAWMVPVEPTPKGKGPKDAEKGLAPRATGSQKLGDYLKDVMAEAKPVPAKVSVPEAVPVTPAVSVPKPVVPLPAPVAKKEASIELEKPRAEKPQEPARPVAPSPVQVQAKKETPHPKHFIRSDYVKEDVRAVPKAEVRKEPHHPHGERHGDVHAEKPGHVPVARVPVPAPVSLSALGTNKAINDQKQPTAKNLGDLRAALAAVVGGNLPEPKAAPAPIHKIPTHVPVRPNHLQHASAPVQHPHKPVATPVSKPPHAAVHPKASETPVAPKEHAHAHVPAGPKEVPEDVLRTILKSE